MAPPRTAQDRAVGQSRSPLDVTALELLAPRGWHGGDEAPLGEWLLRAGGGFTGRANSALGVGDPGMPLPDAVDAVTRWYTDRGLRRLTPAAAPPPPRDVRFPRPRSAGAPPRPDAAPRGEARGARLRQQVG